MADEHQHATPGNVPPSLVVHLGDQRASGVDSRQRPRPCVLLNFSRDAMGAEDGDGSRRHVLQRLDEARAFRLEQFDHVAIVDDLMAHVDRSAVFGQRPLDNIDRPNNASAKPAWLSKNDLHSPAFSPKPRWGSPDDRLIQTREPMTSSGTPSIRGERGPDKRLGLGRPPHRSMWERAPICPAAAGLRRAEAIRAEGTQLRGELGLGQTPVDASKRQ